MNALLLALAFAAPDVDDAVRTGASAPADAAVVIGIEDYFMLPDVPYAHRDAQAFRGFLRYTRGVAEHRIRLLSTGANRELVLGAVEEMAESVEPGGTLWVYFAGHGAADPESGERILLGADAQANMDTFQARAIRVAELRELADGSAGEAVLVLDTCYTGRSRDGGDIVEGKRFAVPTYAEPSDSKVVEWTAASAGEWSGPMNGAEHGAFTYLVLGALRGWADGHISGERDGQVDLEEAHAFVSDRMWHLGVTEQHPHLSGGGRMVLSGADEESPELEADELLEATPSDDTPSIAGSGEVGPDLDHENVAQIEVEAPPAVTVLVDDMRVQPECAGCGGGMAYALEPGTHVVEVRNLMNRPVVRRQVTVARGERVTLTYRSRNLTEGLRGDTLPWRPTRPLLGTSSGASSNSSMSRDLTPSE